MTVTKITYMPNTQKHSGMSGIPTQLLVVHSAESPLLGGYAQALTNWANTTAVEASWHWFADPIAIVSMVDPMLAAWHASEANPMSEGFEQAGYARFSRAEWLTADGRKSIDNLAWIMVQRMKANGIPHRWLTTPEVESITKGGNRTLKGLCLHRQVDPESRTDPGDNYPFDYLDERIRVHLGTTTPTPTPQEDTLSAAEVKQIKDHINAVLLGGYTWEGKKHPGIGMVVEENQRRIDATPDKVWSETVHRGGGKISVKQELADAKTEAQALRAAVAKLVAASGGSSLTAEEITAAVKAGLEEGTVDVNVNVNGNAGGAAQ
jgi:hypothetical protein